VERVNDTPAPVLARAPARSRPRTVAAPVWALLLAALGASGCGRKATVEDCEQIVRRIAELELKDVVPKEELGGQVQQAQQTFRERALADCVGRRITERSLACVSAAQTAEAVIDDCFD
jgi:hypothetical protein